MTDPASVIAAIGGAVASILGGVALIIAASNRRQLSSPDANGMSLRQEVQAMKLTGEETQRSLETHLQDARRQLDEARPMVAWVRRQMQGAEEE